MNDAIVCEKCNYDLFMICPDGLTVCNSCGEFSRVLNVPTAIDDETKKMVLELCKAVDSYDRETNTRVTNKLADKAKQIRKKLEAGNGN